MDNKNPTTTPQIQSVTNQNIQPTPLEKAQQDIVAQSNINSAETKNQFEAQKVSNTEMQADLKTQSQNSIETAKNYAEATKATEEAKQAATADYEAKVQAEYQRQQIEAQSILKPLQEKEKAQQDAELASLQSENRQNEENFKIQADATYQSSLIGLNKLG